MNPKNTWILVMVAAGLFAFIWFFERHLHPPPPPSLQVLPDFKAVSVTSVQIQPAGRLEIRADFTNNGWQLTKPLVYPAQGQAVDALLQGLEQLSFQMRISADALVSHPKSEDPYGVITPRCTILIEEGEQAARTLKLGNLTPPGDQMYVQVVGMEGVDVVSADLLKLIPRDADVWRDPAFASLKGVALDRVSVTNGTKALELRRDPTNRLWHMEWPMQSRADNEKILDLLDRLRTLRVSRFVTNDPRADLESFGLQPAQWTMTLGQGTNVAQAFQFGKSPTNDDGEIYARYAGQDGIVLVPRDQLDPWCAGHENFRDPRLAGLTSGALDSIEVSGAETESFTVQRLTNDIWVINAKSTNLPATLLADGPLMRDFIDHLAGLEVTPVNGQFAVSDAVTESSLPTYGLAPPVRKYILNHAVTNAAGALTNQVVVELDFGSEKDGKIFARRPDEKSSVYAVTNAEFARLPSHALDLMQRRIWYFTEDKVKSLSIREDGATRQFAHAGTNEWVVVRGNGIAEGGPTEAAAGELGALQAASWVECGVTNLAKYGISEKSPRITVEFFPQFNLPSTALDLGDRAPDQRRYGSISGGGHIWVFELTTEFTDHVIPWLHINQTNH